MSVLGLMTGCCFRRLINFVVIAFLIGHFSSALAAGAWFICDPVATMVYFGSRVHVQCSSGYGASGSIVYFALPAVTSNDIQQANELQSMAMTAISTGKQLGFYFDDADTSGISFGCGAGDCRKLSGAWIAK